MGHLCGETGGCSRCRLDFVIDVRLHLERVPFGVLQNAFCPLMGGCGVGPSAVAGGGVGDDDVKLVGDGEGDGDDVVVDDDDGWCRTSGEVLVGDHVVVGARTGMGGGVGDNELVCRRGRGRGGVQLARRPPGEEPQADGRLFCDPCRVNMCRILASCCKQYAVLAFQYCNGKLPVASLRQTDSGRSSTRY
jgi:hypothetical protein